MRKAFSLIELMVVVAVVAILGSVAVPAYQTYLIRTRVAEGLQLLTSAKVSVIENATNGLPFRSAFKAPSPTKWVKSVEVHETSGAILLTFQKALTGAGVEYTLWMYPKVREPGSSSGSAFLFGTSTGSVIPDGSVFVWTCRVEGTLGAGTVGTLPMKYAPQECYSLNN